MRRSRTATPAVASADWQGEHFTFRSIWLAADALHRGAKNADGDKFPRRMAATLLLYTAYEGFLNHVIERLRPAVWQQERTFFRKFPYEGTMGKTLFLATEAGMTLQRTSRPYTTVAELHAWRNDLVHPRTLRKRGRARADAYARKPAAPVPAVFRKLRPAFTERCFRDVDTLADSILLAASQRSHVEGRELSNLGQRAFTGVVGVGGADLSP